jgi:hypothetical protein
VGAKLLGSAERGEVRGSGSVEMGIVSGTVFDSDVNVVCVRFVCRCKFLNRQDGQKAS